MTEQTVEDTSDRRRQEPNLRQVARFTAEEIARAFGLTPAEVRKRLEERRKSDAT
jgi:DNA-directed RNA polymerase specialized sigma24 family protein